ncbi:MAG: aminotransferase class I/II-fold pyridoxal phosphate-dependent enzyme [Candidatus Accumulibacter sp.]|jgi:dTDP-4-amino-4,6-dideoxygalactose transaminase|nr:aminotransferase class I/II-fold pyridoxal phosphate-dependent enzyme [Accumulibacter sp.]
MNAKSKCKPADLAILGGEALFAQKLPAGQVNIPEWERFEKISTGIFERKYYSNHGPLAQEFEERLIALFGTKHACTVTNATIGLALASKISGLKPGDRVIVPAFTFAATVQALTWAGLIPVFCDVDPLTHTMTAQTAAPLLNGPDSREIRAILGVHLWGNACDIESLDALAREHGLLLFFDAAHAVGCTHKGISFGNFGACEVFSFHAAHALNSTEGGCVATNDDELAERVRNIRSSYGRHATVPIPVNANGRFSEMQAAFGLLSLEDFPENCARNARRFHAYADGLKAVPGLRFLQASPGERHNHQYVILEVDEKDFGLCRDDLARILNAENVSARGHFMPGMHRCPPYRDRFPQYVHALPVTDRLCERVMQLPSGQIVTDEHIAGICALVRFVHEHAEELSKALQA